MWHKVESNNIFHAAVNFIMCTFFIRNEKVLKGGVWGGGLF